MNDVVQNIIDNAKRLNHQIEMVSNVKSGKEATVYRVKLDGKLVAMKLYKNPEERSFKKTGYYLMGKYYRKPSHRRAVAKGNKFAKKLKHKNWVKREFYMLEKLYNLGAKIPKPLLHIDSAIFMEFLGDMETVAPRLCDVELNKDEAEIAFKEILETIRIFWDFGIAHADLSEYNILWFKGEPHIIDLPQGIDKRTHPTPEEILERDLKNITKYFGKVIEIDPVKIRKVFS